MALPTVDDWSFRLGNWGQQLPEVDSIYFSQRASRRQSDVEAVTAESPEADEFEPETIRFPCRSFAFVESQSLSHATTFARWRPPRHNVKVESVRFGESPVDTTWRQGKPLPTSTSPAKVPKPHAAPTFRPPSPPPGVPLRDRLQAALQPPVDLLIDDYRVWLPFEPFGYQYEGINFLASRWGALLADEMGLGKTMQTIMALRLLLRSGQIRSVLLVCPKPLVTNWLREFRQWAEEIPVTPIQGSLHSRRHAWLHDRAPVKLANYESLARDADLLDENRLTFDLTVLDEAQRIKNRDSRTAKVVQGIRRKRSWALTGTPVENHAGDLLSLLEFVDKDLVISDTQPGALRDAVSGLILRRTKEMVALDIPEKRIDDVYIDLGAEQRLHYDLAEKEGVVRLNELGDELAIEHVFDLIRRLKQICNFDPLTGESAKTDQLRSDLEEVIDSGKKAILFSQWVGTIDWLAERLQSYSPLVYHGKVANRDRDRILAEFRENDDRSVILMSYGTGAVGLNLQNASYVFLFDRWWNPAIEDQAINRAHRIGQKQVVTVRRYITPASIEERIHAILTTKRELFAEIIDGHNPEESLGLTKAEIIGLFDLKVRQAVG